MKRWIVLTIIVLLLVTTVVHAAPSLGLQGSGQMGGFSIRFRDLEQHGFTPQVFGYVYLSPGDVDAALGLRGLYSLGRKGPVQRYAGVGAGYSYWSWDSDGRGQISGQVFVGIEFSVSPLAGVPITLSLEGTLDGWRNTGRGWGVGNGIGTGIHYRF